MGSAMNAHINDLQDLRYINATLRARLDLWEQKGPLEGDFVDLDGERKRIAGLNPDGTSFAVAEEPVGYHLTKQGHIQYSGGFSAPIRKKLIEAFEWDDACCWFFHHDEGQAHNGVRCQIPVRVWTVA